MKRPLSRKEAPVHISITTSILYDLIQEIPKLKGTVLFNTISSRF
jgi:hypothetical protein